MTSDILVVDDETDIREQVSGILEDEGYATRLARDSEECFAAIEERRPSLVILDIWLQGSRLDGLEVLTLIKRQHPDLPVVIISGHGNIETAVQAIRRGAYDYIEKPFKADRLILVTQRALEAQSLKRENRELRERSTVSMDMIGKSTVLNQLRASLDRVAPTNSRVMIRGPSGAGKELAARLLHQKSNRAAGNFVVLNAAVLEAQNVEVELFGTEDRLGGPRKVGALEGAHNGTLYIDEVAEMPMETQSKVLRVLVEQKFQRVGGNSKVHVDVRIISSTSHDLELDMSQNRFREDLFHRLNVVPIKVPGLSERREDIPELIDYFVKQIAGASGSATAQDRRGRGRRAAVLCLARQRPPAPQHHRAAADPRRWRGGPADHRRHAAGGDRAQHDIRTDEGLRPSDVDAAAGCSRGVRTRLSGGADQPLRRQHLEDRRVRRDGALGVASEAADPRCQFR